MPAPKQNPITLTVDGREIEAFEGEMLVDAAKQGDIEIPVFCYEPKLGTPTFSLDKIIPGAGHVTVYVASNISDNGG